jgi:succinate dehydrogenase/fumarate reductase cytochrome b subunit
VLGGCSAAITCNGIRHLIRMPATASSPETPAQRWIVVAVSLIATVVSWIVGLRLV